MQIDDPDIDFLRNLRQESTSAFKQKEVYGMLTIVDRVKKADQRSFHASRPEMAVRYQYSQTISLLYSPENCLFLRTPRSRPGINVKAVYILLFVFFR